MFMGQVFVPYSGRRPAPLDINGHRVLILGQERDSVEGGLELFGADRVKAVRLGDSQEEQDEKLRHMAQVVGGGVVIAPTDIELPELIENLRTQLPWIQ